MKIDLRVVDLRDDSEETFSLESWETIRQAKLRGKASLLHVIPYRVCEGDVTEPNVNSTRNMKTNMQSLIYMKARKGISEVEQHYYLNDELLNNAMPMEQLRSHAIRTGVLPKPAEGQMPQATTVKMYIGKEPVDFADMLMADVIAKLKKPEEDQKVVKIRVHKSTEDTLTFRVNARTITVDGVKAELVRALGPPSFTGLNIENILLYPRDKQPGRPLQGEEIRDIFGPRPRVDLEAYPIRPPITLICVVLRWGIILKERFEIAIEDHLLLGDLKKVILEKLNNSSNPKISQRYTPDNIVFKLSKMRIDAATSNTLRRKYGVEADELWLRVFNIKDGSKVVIPV